MMAIQTDAKGYLATLIFISLVISDVEHHSMCLLAICLLQKNAYSGLLHFKSKILVTPSEVQLGGQHPTPVTSTCQFLCEARSLPIETVACEGKLEVWTETQEK